MASNTAMQQLLLQLKTQINEEIHVGPWLTIDQERIEHFATVTGDRQWIHTDPQRCEQESPYATTVAHWLSDSVPAPLPDRDHSSGFFPTTFPRMSHQINYGLNKVRFPAPVRVNSQVRAKTVLLAATDIGNTAIQIAYLVSIEIKGEDKPACVAEYLVRIYP